MRTYAGMVAFCEAQHVHPTGPRSGGLWNGMCQGFAREAVGAAPWAASALKAWFSIPATHRHSGFPRAGGIAYYDTASVPDYRDFGHATPIVENGYVWSTDALRAGKVDKVPYTFFAAHWGMRYLGWIDWTPSGLIRLKPTAPAPAPQPVLAYRQGKQVFSSKMHVGQANSDSVWNLTLALRAHGVNVAVGTAFTSVVRNAVGVFQRSRGWSGAGADGIPGPQTIHDLGLIWVQG